MPCLLITSMDGNIVKQVPLARESAVIRDCLSCSNSLAANLVQSCRFWCQWMLTKCVGSNVEQAVVLRFLLEREPCKSICGCGSVLYLTSWELNILRKQRKFLFTLLELFVCSIDFYVALLSVRLCGTWGKHKIHMMNSNAPKTSDCNGKRKVQTQQ